ncbi:hypothetical protein FDW83_07280 [Pseudarthrobacter sp. NamE2]|uniref:hypothetical protein n=1 Tax=Pseudarthrobacter sp. NamE2 TaxID=2576838 RepID=UPI0010FF0B82|nr:hypothetical protein [Pseudarthrobacter sp. NamE2]TLM84514.1 hypothetical protein FDW83_07280 [Pseudarthrobacter sp. NamE2]
MIRTPLQRLAGAAMAVSLLAGCTAPDLDGDVAIQLQQRVATAKQYAAGQDYPAALAELDQLSQEVTAAAEQGRVSEPRKGRIDAAISTIRNDLEAAAAPAPRPAQTSPAPAPPLTEDQKEREEEARKDAEEAREEARKEAEKAREEAEKQREEAQKEAEKQRNGG